MPLELVDKQRGAFNPAPFVANGVLNLDLVEHGPVVKGDQECVADGAFGRVVVFYAEALLLDTVDLSAECVDAWVGSRCVGAVDNISIGCRKRGEKKAH